MKVIMKGKFVQVDGKIKKSGFGVLKGISSFTKEDELKAHD